MITEKRRIAGSWRYIPKSERHLPPEQQTVFVLRPLTGAERELISDEVSVQEIRPDGTRRIISRMRTIARQLCVTHIESIERFTQAWPKEPAEREKILELLDDELVFEIGDEIFARSSLGPEDAKQVGESSAPAPTSS